MSYGKKRDELKQDEEPAFAKLFFSLFGIFSLYLIYIFMTTSWAVGGAHH